MDNMNVIWANRLIEGTKSWKDVPSYRRNKVESELESRMDKGEITEDQVLEIFENDDSSK